MIIQADEYTYNGGWQAGAAHLEKLEGPIDHGVIEYANGDRFEGRFQLPFGSIHGEAYTAKGEFRFADGAVIEQAWIINTNNGGGSLEGLYRIKYPNGPDTITPFSNHKRHGLEIVLAEKPYAIEWKMGEKMQELAVESYTFKTLEYDDLTEFTVVFADGATVVENGGQLVANSSYGFRHFKPNLKLSVQYGENTHVGVFKANYEEIGKEHMLPDPMSRSGDTPASVQIRTGHISYYMKSYTYDGELKGILPHGHGVLKSYYGERYEGEFKDGRCHGKGVYSIERSNDSWEGQWVEGEFQDPNAPESPIYLNVHETYSGSKTILAKPGPIEGQESYKIVRVEKDKITLKYFSKVIHITPDHPYHESWTEYGKELSDGTPLEEDKEHELDISWKV